MQIWRIYTEFPSYHLIIKTTWTLLGIEYTNNTFGVVFLGEAYDK